jgi:hypothetical protein
MRGFIRQLGFVVCAAAGAAVFFFLAPDVPKSTPTLSFTDYQSLIEQALTADEANNLRAEGAPQQAVVNGWTARDLLTIIAKENQDLLAAQGAVVDATGTLQTTPFDNRVPGLLLVAIVTLSWAGISQPRSAKVLPPPVVPYPQYPPYQATSVGSPPSQVEREP